MSASDADGRIEAHCRQIDRCNQRGGRMLSAVDLIDAGTILPELAAYCLAAVGAGASFLVGAVPGGAGKTTVMGALLNFVPADVPLAAADGTRTIERGLARPHPRRCYICHEIGSGPYYAYLWGQALRQYFRLPEAGDMLATNLHADNPAQVREQVCRTNGVPEAALRQMNLMLFMSVGHRRRPSRRIQEVWESDGRQAHRKVFDAVAGEGLVAPSVLAAPRDVEAAGEAIAGLLAGGARTIKQVRTALVRHPRQRTDED
jgi:hypothetical protein